MTLEQVQVLPLLPDSDSELSYHWMPEDTDFDSSEYTLIKNPLGETYTRDYGFGPLLLCSKERS